MARAVVDAICAEAAAEARLDDFGDEWFLGPLAAWAEDLAQPNLNDFGRRFLRSLAVRDIARRLRVLDVLRRHPEIADVAIPPVVYITGLPRSGTTLLHNVLACHPAARALLRWELMQPVPPPEAESHSRDPRIVAVQAPLEKLRGSLLERMHWVNADEPEECAWGFIDAISMLGQIPAAMCMPRWRQFLLDEDLTPAYLNYRSVVQILLWKNPVRRDGCLVLKAPQVATHIAAFARAFPEAHFVIPDRDPYRSVVSATVAGRTIIEPFVEDNPLDDDGIRQQIMLRWAVPTLPAIAEFTSARPERITHVAYPDLITDPAATAHGIFAAAGFPSGEGLTRAIGAFFDAQRAGGRAAPPPELPTMGYTEEDVRSVPAVRNYCERFNVQRETKRLVGVHGSL